MNGLRLNDNFETGALCTTYASPPLFNFARLVRAALLPTLRNSVRLLHGMASIDFLRMLGLHPYYIDAWDVAVSTVLYRCLFKFHPAAVGGYQLAREAQGEAGEKLSVHSYLHGTSLQITSYPDAKLRAYKGSHSGHLRRYKYSFKGRMMQSAGNPNKCITWWTRRHLLGKEVVPSRIRTLRALYKFRRSWVVNFCRAHARRASVYLHFTSVPKDYERAGPFDHSLVEKEFLGDRFVENDAAYVELLCQTEFALCPAGDQPFSFRIYEAIAAGAIPVLEHSDHFGRNGVECSLGLIVTTVEQHANGSVTYDPRIAQHNRDLFLKTLKSSETKVRDRHGLLPDPGWNHDDLAHAPAL